jgi:glycosyltransferase involved in cell wall biosynthesis
MSKEPILFISHDALPTGAPFLLLHLLRWLRANVKLDFEIVVARTGPLQAQFAELAPVVVFQQLSSSLVGRAAASVGSYRLKRMVDELMLRYALGRKRFALIYSNTLVNGIVLERIPDQKCPLISHVHELERAIQRHTAPVALSCTLRRTSQFIAGSRAVARNLIDNHGVDPAKVEVVYEFIPTAHAEGSKSADAKQRLRSELGISARAFVVGAAGSMDWRKGYDLFIPLALSVFRSRPQLDVQFIWLGGAWDQYVPGDINYELQKLGIESRVHFIGHKENYLDYMAIFDVFCLTSREDPFPLVALEAASLEKPVLCFANAGGTPEFVENDCGFVIPYLDVMAMSTRIVELIENPSLRDRLGRHARAKVLERHDVEVVAPRIMSIIERLLASRSDSR